jgi:hypothetical protein
MRVKAVFSLVRTYLRIPHGREAGFPGWDARRERRSVLIAHKPRVTMQRTWKAASRLIIAALVGFDPLAPSTVLRALPIVPAIGCGARLASGAIGSETRFMGDFEIGSRACGDYAALTNGRK